MKKHLLILLFLSISFCFANAADVQQPAPSAKNASQSKLSEEETFKQNINNLINQRRKISMEIYQARVDLIKTDPNLKILHQAIIDLHEKMATELNANPRMVTLIDKGNQIDLEIAKAIQDYQTQKSSVSQTK